MDTNDWAKLLPEKIKDFSDVLQQCKDGAFGDPTHTALAVSKIKEIFSEVIALQERITQAAEQDQ